MKQLIFKLIQQTHRNRKYNGTSRTGGQVIERRLEVIESVEQDERPARESVETAATPVYYDFPSMHAHADLMSR